MHHGLPPGPSSLPLLREKVAGSLDAADTALTPGALGAPGL